MVLYTIKEVNNEIQVLDTMGIESLKSITEAVDKLDISEEEKQKIFMDNKIFQVVKPEDFLIAHTTTARKIETDRGNFYILGKMECLSVKNNDDQIFAGVKDNGETLIKGEPVVLEDLISSIKQAPKPR